MISISFFPDACSKNLHFFETPFPDPDHPASYSLSFYTYCRVNTFAL
jgi:hypothetical protein